MYTYAYIHGTTNRVNKARYLQYYAYVQWIADDTICREPGISYIQCEITVHTSMKIIPLLQLHLGF